MIFPKLNYIAANRIYFFGSLIIITFFSFTFRRSGIEFGLLLLVLTRPIMETDNAQVYINSILVSLIFIVYETFDALSSDPPTPDINYETVRGIGFTVFFIITYIMIVHNNEDRSREVNSLNQALAFEKKEQEKLKISNKDLQQLIYQLDRIVEQKTHEYKIYHDAINLNIYSSMHDLNGNFVKVNKPFSQALGFWPTELIGKNIRFIDGGFQTEEFYKIIEDKIATGQTWRGEIKTKTKMGSVLWIDQIIIPIKLKENKVIYYLTLALPITERKLHEEVREKTLSVLENIAFHTSHKVRGPLARIQGLLWLIENEHIKNEEWSMVTSRLNECSYELNHSTRDLVKFVTDHQHSIQQTEVVLT